MMNRSSHRFQHFKGLGSSSNGPQVGSLPPLQPKPFVEIKAPENCAAEPEPAAAASDQIVETDFAELNDGTLVDLVQDSENSRRTLLAVWKDGEVRYLDELK